MKVCRNSQCTSERFERRPRRHGCALVVLLAVAAAGCSGRPGLYRTPTVPAQLLDKSVEIQLRDGTRFTARGERAPGVVVWHADDGTRIPDSEIVAVTGRRTSRLKPALMVAATSLVVVGGIGYALGYGLGALCTCSEEERQQSGRTGALILGGPAAALSGLIVFAIGRRTKTKWIRSGVWSVSANPMPGGVNGGMSRSF